ncbi:alpha/beta hydrolase family esterase [Paractinoplanes atraurantiacus]|uniref:Poly(3-hydroxybutyrate) depolymerase n=1 Tax=Paractinoplanes atraurantiacus TaxID=1036182 RepID=A0A285KCP8_9ACTN|nr:PHB depolymerase family esterase [Actinoplanes atraurantiacus]SNY70380.1 Poly(3-hydroxybutyrate) depolymerase [Actinoplanes atraurantiacus]
MDRRTLLGGSAALAVAAGLSPTPASASTGAARSLDGRPFPGYDYSRANKLPREMAGWWTKSFDNGRTAKVYISPETPIRSYFTVIAVPEGGSDAVVREWRRIADEREEGLFILEPGPGGWGTPEEEAAYVGAALAFFQSNRYFSIFGLHYLVGYGAGGPALEAWAVAHPLRVIAQAYVDSPGLRQDYLDGYASRTFDGTTDGYTPVVFPPGFDLIRYDETVLPTLYADPRRSIGPSLAYWKKANRGDRWMTSHAGPIARTVVRHGRVSTRQILAFLTFYTRYENFFAYGNQLFERADYDRLGVEVHTMTVNGFVREYLVYRPESARRNAPVLFVWPGNSQTDKVFLDATQWWKVARREGFLLVVVCEQYSVNSVSVSHRDSLSFFRQLRETVIARYDVDPTRFYSTGQSAGSSVTQNLAIAFPEYFAAVASTSFTAAPDAAGNVTLDGVAHPASNRPIPTYQIYGYGDLAFLEGTLWDDIDNQLDAWAGYHLRVNGLTLGDVVQEGRSGYRRRFQTWSWKRRGIPVVKVTKNLYRSHNTMAEECPLLWDFLKHYRCVPEPDGSVTRYYDHRRL